MLLVLVLVPGVLSVTVPGCCPRGSRLSLEPPYSCEAAAGDTETAGAQLQPKIFSLEAEAFINEALEVAGGGGGVPECGAGERRHAAVISAESEEEFVIVAEDASIFLAADTSTHSRYCLAAAAGGVAAVYCAPDPRARCGEAVCAALCCPPHMVASRGTGGCQPRWGMVASASWLRA